MKTIHADTLTGALAQADDAPILVVNNEANVPSAAVASLRDAYAGASVLLVRTVRQYGQHSELIDGRFHERPLIAESTVGCGCYILTADVLEFARSREITSVAKLFNAVRDAGLPFLTHEWL
jgi:hypothetical protein